MDKNQGENIQGSVNSSAHLIKPNIYEKVPIIQGGQANQIESNVRGVNRPVDNNSSHQYLQYVNYQPNYVAPTVTPQVNIDLGYSSSPHRHQSFSQPHLHGIQSQKVRMRVSKACDRCRGQKIKCSGTMPCNTCLKHKKECKYSTQNSGSNVNPGNHEQLHTNNIPNKRTRIESPVSDGDGNSNVYNTNSMPSYDSELRQLPVSKEVNYVRHLENRVQYLESILLQNASTAFKPIKVRDRDDDDDDDEVNTTLIRSSNKWRYLRRHQVLLTIKLCQSMYTNLSEENKKKVVIPRSQYFGWNMSGCNYVSTEQLPELPEFKLPTSSEVYFDFFFHEINSVFAVLHEKLFRDQAKDYEMLFKNQFQIDANERDAKTNQTRLFLAILYLVYALAIRFQEFQKEDGPNLETLKLEEQLFKYSYKVVSILSFEWESFELIQSWLLIAIYLRISHRQTSSCQALGHAIMMTRSMGLGKNNPKLLTVTPYIKLKAKRIFWCVYTIDRLFGLLSGRYCGLINVDNMLQFEGFDFEAEKDTWLTLPAFALMHVARISNFIHTSTSDEFGFVKLQQINKEVNRLDSFLNENGFGNESLFDDQNDILPVAKAQVKLHYYDLINCIHGKLLFNYVGTKISNQGLKIDMVFSACEGIIDILDQMNKAKLLYTPWYLFLSLLFDTGINAITLINGGVQNARCKRILQGSIRLISTLSDAAVKDEQGEVVIANRYTMAKECLWAMKMTNRILSLRLEQDMNDVISYGIDHGSAEVNKQTFNQFGLDNKESVSEESTSQQLDNRTAERSYIMEREILPLNVQQMPNALNDSSIAPNINTSVDYIESSMDHHLSNLHWFDQWLDYNYDM